MLGRTQRARPAESQGAGSKESRPHRVCNPQLEAHNIEYILKNDATGHFHCRRKSDDALVQFWAGTGKILGYTQRGIHNLIRICEEE